MAPCSPVHFKVQQGNGYYKMTTYFVEIENKCLEGNRFASTSTLKGAALAVVVAVSNRHKGSIRYLVAFVFSGTARFKDHVCPSKRVHPALSRTIVNGLS